MPNHPIRLPESPLSRRLIALCAALSVCAGLCAGACGKSSKSSTEGSSKQSTKRRAAEYMNELARVHKGVVVDITRYRNIKRPSPHVPEKLRSARLQLAQSLTHWEKELAKVKAPFAAANEFHAAYLEFMKQYLGFMRAGLALDTAYAAKKPGQPALKALHRTLMTAKTAFDEATLRMEKERKKFVKKVGIELEQ